LLEAQVEVATLNADRARLHEAVKQLQHDSTQDHARWSQQQQDFEARRFPSSITCPPALL
jgi:hypothetical protein